jgi:hypothetical protein
MLISRSRRLMAVAAPIVASLTFAARSGAVPINVHLRVEGNSTTLFEGNVTTDSRVIEAPDFPKTKGEPLGPPHPHNCDVKDNGEFPAGSFGTPYGNPTTALYDMASSLGLAFNAYWYSPLNDFFVNGVGPLGAEGTESWGYAVNNTTASVGGCQFQLAPGSEVLWASNFGFAKHLLALSGPTAVNAGAPFSVQVTDGQTGEPISEATIGEVAAGVTTPLSATKATDASGRTTLSLDRAGTVTLKAIRSDSVRSNGILVCVHNGNDGSCGTTPAGTTSAATTPAPRVNVSIANVARIVGIKNGRRYARRVAPRELLGLVKVPAGGTLRDVRIRLERRFHGHCSNFSGAREEFVRARSCGRASFFSVGATESFSYLLPARLPRGRYVYDIEALDSAGHVSNLVSGVSHVVFRVS